MTSGHEITETTRKADYANICAPSGHAGTDDGKKPLVVSTASTNDDRDCGDKKLMGMLKRRESQLQAMCIRDHKIRRKKRSHHFGLRFHKVPPKQKSKSTESPISLAAAGAHSACRAAASAKSVEDTPDATTTYQGFI